MGKAPCCDKTAVKKGPWSPDEDSKLIDYITVHGFGNWRALPKQAGLRRCGKSCRLRWINYLRPDLKRGNMSAEEVQTIIRLHQILGNKWSAIASHLPGRTDNEIKNFWNTHLKKLYPSSSSSFASATSRNVPDTPASASSLSSSGSPSSSEQGMNSNYNGSGKRSSAENLQGNSEGELHVISDYIEMDDYWNFLFGEAETETALNYSLLGLPPQP